MGLDQYLKASKYCPGLWEHERDAAKKQEAKDILKSLGLKDEDVASSSRGIEVAITVAYWRKSNQIHAWFVKTVQDGNDNCGTYCVSREQLQELIDECKNAIANKDKAAEILPTQAGFFFGGTEYDEWYWNDLKDTVKELTAVLANTRLADFSFDYHSSW